MFSYLICYDEFAIILRQKYIMEKSPMKIEIGKAWNDRRWRGNMDNRVNYGNKASRKACNRIIMAINSVRPMTRKDQRFDYAYAIFLTVLGIFVPMFCIPWLMTINKPLTALIVSAISIGIAATIGLSIRGKILKSFYIINDAHNYVTIKDGNEKLEDFFKIDEVLLSTIPQNDCYMDVLYNWLCWRKLVNPNEEVTWYRVDCKILEPYLNEDSDLSDQDSVLFMTFKKRLPNDATRFFVEAAILGVCLLK